ncbi:MAG TPA: DUF29 domain-containing protein [Cyanobacteria bacterium UBA11162]|nr:DUF29 domain-containing protein [Cyanobacteria bacterium UBA11162]
MSDRVLYDQDFYLWLQTTANLLKDKRFDELDLTHLVEEIESMGRSEKRELKSRLKLILAHLLKWQYQPQVRPYYGNSWISTIVTQRSDLLLLLADSPSLKSSLEESWQDCYQIARRDAANETGLSVDVFPVDCPFDLAEVLNPDYLPK